MLDFVVGYGTFLLLVLGFVGSGTFLLLLCAGFVVGSGAFLLLLFMCFYVKDFGKGAVT